MSAGVGTAAHVRETHPPTTPRASAPADDPRCDPEQGCITCGDVAVEMRVVRIDHERDLALCEDDTGDRRTVEIALVHPVADSDTVLVHAGTAISNLGPAEHPTGVVR